jgi:hypothetical protein
MDPCLGCDEPTGVGSVFYSDRHRYDRSDGTTAWLCSSCDARIRATRSGRQLSDDEVRSLVENASAAGILWSSGGSIPG